MNYHCIICEKETPNSDYMYPEGKAEFHPSDGTQFRSYGHYGSTVFDPMDGSYVDIVICNSCLEGHKEKFMYKVNK